MLAHLALLGVSLASAPADSLKSMSAVRVPAGEAPPSVDGRLDDPVWTGAGPARGFVQYAPSAGAPATHDTEVRVAYDDQAVYVAVRMYDPHPDSIVGQLARRDADVHSDWALIGFDSYHDRRTGFAFAVNPRGVKQDIFLFDDTGSDIGWNAVWDAAARVDSAGWTAEFRIPLSQLRYSARDLDAGGRVWGFNVKRVVARSREESFWAPILPNSAGVVSRFGELRGIGALPSPRSLEVLPYSVAQLTRAPEDPGNPFYARNDPGAGVGADIKYGINSSLTLTATLNPDFGQVEADPSQVNLSAYETFFPEQRPFFVEGSDIFRFGLGAGDGDFGSEALFYSRRIGRAPQGVDDRIPGDAEFSQVPEASNILAAAKVTGRTRSGWSLGFMDAVTGREQARYLDPFTGQRVSTAVEPLTNYGVARVIRAFGQGERAVGGIVTAVNRDLRDGDSLGFLRSAAYAGGLDARTRYGGGNYEVRGWVLGSAVRGDSAAMWRTQRSSTRYFQRPDAGHLELDPARESLLGWAASVETYKMGGGNWRWATVLNARSPGFETNDLGYQRDADQVLWAGNLGYRQSTSGPRFRSWNVNLNGWTGYTFGGERTSLGGNANGSLRLLSFWGANGGFGFERPVVSTRALRGGPSLETPASYNAWAGVSSDSRRSLYGSLNASAGWDAEEDGYGWNVNTSLTWRASTRSDLSLQPSYSRSLNTWQFVDSDALDGGPHYVFARMEQSTASLTARLSYTFTPDLSLQLYAQPFLGAGDAGGFREVALADGGRRVVASDGFSGRFRPLGPATLADDEYRADTDGDGVANVTFTNPDFNLKEFRSNAVLRWEYRPGSTLFVVWSQGREDFDRDGRFGLMRDTRRLFGMDDAFPVRSTNVLLVKVNYWLSL
ncbi:MAG TPA: DUF5916 domain-containing protein [Longimicrobiaceae bacterium]|nr:DUF5916 domain-containing protein [Longimicrobiaceae bacterium]